MVLTNLESTKLKIKRQKINYWVKSPIKTEKKEEKIK